MSKIEHGELMTTHLFPRGMLAGLVALLLSAGSLAAAQLRHPTPLSPAPDSTSEPSPTPEQQKQLEKQANVQRQKDIKKDTDKLLQLATELKESVDRTDENVMSLDVIRKAEQIEKLAKAVKEKMKGP